MSNFDEFKNFLIEHNLPFTEETEEEYSAIIFTETVENGPKVRIYFAFMNNDNLVSAYVFDYI
ncbi:MAG: hypothetical protein PHV06_03715 [bacterium]|nr:hypothetical protein [bacterium]